MVMRHTPFLEKLTMKKYISLLLAAALIFLCSCSDDKSYEPKTPDMLNITNTEETFLGCKSRLDAVIEAMSAKINILETAHNNVIKSQNHDSFFLENDYIHTVFEPFVLSAFSVTEGFNKEMTNETAQDFYKLQSNGKDITFTSEGENYELTFTSESVIESYIGRYDSENDSLQFIYTVEVSGNETVEEFLEFSKAKNGAYFIQSLTERCCIEFNKNDEIVYFTCGKLNSGDFSADGSIYPSPEKGLDVYWVTEKGKTEFANIHTFEENMLTHEDRSSGPWKTIRINAEDYASAFYAR